MMNSTNIEQIHPWIIKNYKNQYLSVNIPVRLNQLTNRYKPNECRPALLMFGDMNDAIKFRKVIKHKYLHYNDGMIHMNENNNIKICLDSIDSEQINKNHLVCTQFVDYENLFDYCLKTLSALIEVVDYHYYNDSDILNLNGVVTFPENYLESDLYDENILENLNTIYFL